MKRAVIGPAVVADAAAVTELVVARESSLYGKSAFSRADLEDEWSGLDLVQNARVVRYDERIVGYGAVHGPGAIARAEACVHPDALGRGIGKMLATVLEEIAARDGARAIRNSVLEADSAGRALLESLGYVAVRVFREMRIEPRHDALDFYAAHQEAFAEHWGHTPRDFESWSKSHLATERFDPTLWCVVRAGEEIAGGTICAAETYGGGFVHALFTRRPWRKQGVGSALLGDSFRRFWERGEHSVGLGVDAASATGAFRLYERGGMAPAIGGVVYEKALADAV
jgi:ribosomal protein S18 acetylase RimI-like enzyme